MEDIMTGIRRAITEEITGIRRAVTDEERSFHFAPRSDRAADRRLRWRRECWVWS